MFSVEVIFSCLYFVCVKFVKVFSGHRGFFEKNLEIEDNLVLFIVYLFLSKLKKNKCILLIISFLLCFFQNTYFIL